MAPTAAGCRAVLWSSAGFSRTAVRAHAHTHSPERQHRPPTHANRYQRHLQNMKERMLIHGEGATLTKAEKPKAKAKLGPGNTTAGPEAFKIQELVKPLIADFYMSTADEMRQRIEKEASITQGYLDKFLESPKREVIKSLKPAMASVATKLYAWHERYVPENHDGLRGRWLFPALTQADVHRRRGLLPQVPPGCLRWRAVQIRVPTRRR